MKEHQRGRERIETQEITGVKNEEMNGRKT